MKPRRQRMLFIGLVLAAVAVSAVLGYQAFQENLLYFFSPTEVVAGEAPTDRAFRLGGMVVEDSVMRTEGSLRVQFAVTDYAHDVVVYHERILPDLFREGQGVVARGFLRSDGTFMAEEILAKHDETYMSPEVADVMERAKESPNYRGPDLPPEAVDALHRTGDSLVP